MIKLFYIVLLVLFSNLVFSQVELKIGVYELAPHMIIENNLPNGSVIEFLNAEILPHLDNKKFTSKFTVLPFSRLLTELKDEHIDIACLLVKNEEREKLYQFSNKSLFTTESALVFNKDKFKKDLKEELKTSSQLNGMIIGHTQGSILVKFIQDSTAKIEWMTGEDALQRNIEQLRNNRLSAVFVPTRSHVEYWLKKNKLENVFQITTVPDTKLELYILFRKNISEEVKEKFNKYIDDKIYLKYLNKKIKKK